MSWREQAKFGILSAERFFIGDGDGSLGADITEELEALLTPKTSPLGNPYIYYDPFNTPPSFASWGGLGAEPNPITVPYCREFIPVGGSGFSSFVIYDNISLPTPVTEITRKSDLRSVNEFAKVIYTGNMASGNVGGVGFITGGTLYGGPAINYVTGAKPQDDEQNPRRVRMSAFSNGGSLSTDILGVASPSLIYASWSSVPPFGMKDLPSQVDIVMPAGSVQALIVYRDGTKVIVAGIDGTGPWTWVTQETIDLHDTNVFVILDVQPLYDGLSYGYRWTCEVIASNSTTDVASGDFWPTDEITFPGFTPFFYHEGAAGNKFQPVEMATMLTAAYDSNSWFNSDTSMVLGYDYPTEWKLKFTSEF